MSEPLDQLVEEITDQLSDDAREMERGLVDGLRKRLDEDFAHLQQTGQRASSLRQQLQEAEAATVEAQARYKNSQYLCMAARMIGLRGSVDPGSIDDD